MKQCCLVIFVVMLSRSALFSADDQLSVSESRIPTSAAFSLLGVNPTAVEQPASPMALGASLAGAFGDGNSSSFGNIALEFSPFWWTKKSRQVSYDEFCYLSYDNATHAYRNRPLTDQNLLKNLSQTLTFSLATAETEGINSTNGSGGHAVALGLRSTLIKGRLPAKALESRLKLRGIDREISRNMTITPEGRTEVPDALYEQLLVAEREYASRMEYLAGLQVEVAGGAMMDLVEGTLDNAEFRRAGGWMNASYRGDEEGSLTEQFAVLANVRYFFTETTANDRISSLDVGARISWISPHEKLPITFSAEYVKRFNTGAVDDVDRLGIIATLKFSDRYALYISHGSNIEKDVLSEDDDLTFVGVNVLLEKATANRDQ